MKTANPRRSKAVWDTGEGVEEAMLELSKMEQKLQTAVRTQRLAIESSDLHLKEEAFNEPDIRPKIYTPNQKTIPARQNLEGKSDAVTGTSTAPLDVEDAEVAAGDVAEAEEEDTAERGANRPPPVNSDTLPLPWKGRLGYVSSS